MSSTTMSPPFVDCNNGCVRIKSTWRNSKTNVSTTSSQTSDSLWEFMDTGMQTGIETEILESDVTEREVDRSLLKYLASMYKHKDEMIWRIDISTGKVRVDNEIVLEPEYKVKADSIVEYINTKCATGTQTEHNTVIIPYSPPVSPTAITKTQKFDFDLNDDEKQDSKYDEYHDFKEDKGDCTRTIGIKDGVEESSLDKFLHKLLPIFSHELDSNASSKAFDGYETAVETQSDEIQYWKKLSVDLEKKKVIFPDWTKAKYYSGLIVRTVITRNKERIYDIEYDDGVKLIGVREEYIRVVLNSNDSKRGESKSVAKTGLRLQEGQRVHAKVTMKGGVVKYIPGRVVKGIRGGSYDIECEGGSTQYGMSADDIMIGLDEGMIVEAKRPSQVQLQCTDLTWTCTGNTIAAVYGRLDISGWCDYPGALCLWNIFSKSFNAEEPDYVLDHTSCLMCISCHPQKPSLVAAGSYNGEIIVWDLTAPEQPLGISPILEYTHKDFVVDLAWLWDSICGEWLIVSTSVDGKILFWSLSNSLKHPVRGLTLGTDGAEGSRRKYPSAHGAKSFTFSKSSHANASTSKPQWLVVGQEGGALVRIQTSKVLSQRLLTKEAFKSNSSELYPSVKKSNDTFAHEGHIGPVNDTDSSAFHRNIFLTAGADGILKLFHMLEKSPMHQWEPAPPPGTKGLSSSTSSLTAAQFSPNRPLVFATTSTDGFLYIFDLQTSSLAPSATLECPNDRPNELRTGLTGIAFNTKQREFIAACDQKGNVHIWKLNFDLSTSSSQVNEIELLKSMNVGIVD